MAVKVQFNYVIVALIVAVLLQALCHAVGAAAGRKVTPAPTSVSRRYIALPSGLMADLGLSTVVSRGKIDPNNPFRQVSPVGTAVTTRTPTFRWTARPGAQMYKVEVLDANMDDVVVSEPLRALSWRASRPLPVGAVLRWQVIASSGDKVIDARPVPPADSPKFDILSAHDVATLASHKLGHSMFDRALLDAKAGLLDDAQSDLLSIGPKSPDYRPAQNALGELRRIRRQAR